MRFFSLSETKMKCGLYYAAIKMGVDPSCFFRKSNGIRLTEDLSSVIINKCAVKVDNMVQAVSIMTLAFLAFDLTYNISYKAVVELMEFLLGIRKVPTVKIRSVIAAL